ncbi:MAG TPA: hydroxymethylbilane synthase [Cytophagaceae bacterium]|jgi:hydroxymethylbilane synthase|nr:hydroxymethylbilane synthase [Cytophagaceae bacterium]
MQRIKIGTRGSKLALWQANYIAELLRKAGFETGIITIDTKGDKILNAPFAEIGTKGLFTEELEIKLRNQEIDIAVHSAKDMQSELDDDLMILAFTEREDANDVLVSYKKEISFTDKNLIIGTSSTRRRAILKHFYPHLELRNARGNLQTRMKKMEDGQFDAMILAYAGVHRMNYDQYIVQKLPLNIFTPAVGQGSIAIECTVSLNEEKKAIIRRTVNDSMTEICLLTERAFLRTLQGGCSIPAFGLARLEGNVIHMTGGVLSLDGKTMIREEIRGDKKDTQKLGVELAEKILALGGDKILEDIR